MISRNKGYARKSASQQNGPGMHLLKSPVLQAALLVIALFVGVLVSMSEPPMPQHEISTEPLEIPSDAKLPVLPSWVYDRQQTPEKNQVDSNPDDTAKVETVSELTAKAVDPFNSARKRTIDARIIEPVVLSPKMVKKSFRSGTSEMSVAAVRDKIISQARKAVAAVPGKYPQSSSRFLVAEDLKNMGRQELQVMRNEIYARRSYKFKSTDMQRYFSSQPWYEPRFNSVQGLNEFEINNLKLIRKYEGF